MCKTAGVELLCVMRLPGWAERIRTSRRRFVEQPSTAGGRTHNVIGLHANFGRYFSQMDKTPSGGSNPLSPGRQSPMLPVHSHPTCTMLVPHLSIHGKDAP